MIPAWFWNGCVAVSTVLAVFFLMTCDWAAAFTCAISGIAFLYVETAQNRDV